MKPKTKDELYDHKRLEQFKGPVADSMRQLMREEKRQLKKQISKNRRNADKKNLRDELK